MSIFDSFPLMNAYAVNLDWIIKEIRDIKTYVENYTALNKVAYAGVWDITKQYPQWALVTDGETSWLSLQPVPKGVPLENSDYWQKLADLDPRIAGLVEEVAKLQNELKSTVKFFNTVDDMKVNCDTEGVAICTRYYSNYGNPVAFVVGETNVKVDNFTKIKLNSGLFASLIYNGFDTLSFGCYGDGVHDDTAAMQNIFNLASGSAVNVQPGKYYMTAKISGNDISVFGSGSQSEFIFDNCDGLEITQTMATNQKRSVTVKDVKISQIGKGVGTGLKINGDSTLGDRFNLGPVVDNVNINRSSGKTAFEAGWKTCLEIHNCNAAAVTNVSLSCGIKTAEPDYLAESCGICISNNAEPRGTDIMINNAYITLCEYAVKIDGPCEGIGLLNSRIVGCQHGFFVNQEQPYPLYQIAETHINCSKYGIYAAGIKELSIVNCDIYCQQTTGDSWCVYLNNVKSAIVSHNTFASLNSNNTFLLQASGACEKTIVEANIFDKQSTGLCLFTVDDSVTELYNLDNLLTNITANLASSVKTRNLP